MNEPRTKTSLGAMTKNIEENIEPVKGIGDIQVIKRKATGFFKVDDVQKIKRAVNIGSRIITNASILLRAYIISYFERNGELPNIDIDLIDNACSVVQGKINAQVRVEQDSKSKEQVSHEQKKENKEMKSLKEQTIMDDMLRIYKDGLEGQFANHKETTLKRFSSKDDIEKSKSEEKEEKKAFKESIRTLSVNEKKDANAKEKERLDILKAARKALKEKESLEDQEWNENKLSLSYVLKYSEANLLTAYINNIEAHFTKYPKRFILCDLLSSHPEMKTKDARKIAAIITSHYWFDASIDSLEGCADEIIVDPTKYEDCFPQKISDMPLCYDVKVDPWSFLKKMIEINRSLETQFLTVKEKYRKLLNPIPFHSSSVPMNIRLDTSGITQLLMNMDRIKEFKTLYDLTHGTDIQIHTKADMNSSFKKIHGRDPESDSEEATYASEVWAFLTNLKTCNQLRDLRKNPRIQGNEYVFDNALVTDGISMSIQIIKKESFRRKKRAPKRVSKKSKDSNEENSTLPTHLSRSSRKKIGNDPGKKDILAITDGIKTICYTKGQRQQDCQLFAKQKLTLKRRRKAGLEVHETEHLSKFPKNSCRSETFNGYCRLRFQKEEESSKVYGHDVFRQFKFLTYCNTKSSERKFVDKVNKAFKSTNHPSPKTKCMTSNILENASKVVPEEEKLIIGWGNWGKNPNALKNGSPTPGIGIKRRFMSCFDIETIDEHFSSQTCPCCKERSLKKFQAMLTVPKKPKTNETSEKKLIDIHHLLRCTNDKCKCRLWNRNVVGSYNILSRFLDRKDQHNPEDEALGSGKSGHS